MKVLKKYRFLILRRLVQLTILFLFFGANLLGWNLLTGNYSSATVLDSIQLSDPFAILQTLTTGFWVGADVLISALIILLFYTLLSGRMFCSWVCPVNPISDFVRWLRNKLHIKKNAVKLPWKIRYWILGLSLLLSLIFGVAAFEAISPIGFLHRAIIFGVGAGWSVVAVILFFDLGIVKNGWCGHICPLGSFYSVVGNIGLLKVAHDVDKCTMCNKCFETCPEKQVLSIIGKESGWISSGECTNCARCIEVCNDDALNFSIRGVKKIKTENIS